MILDLVTSVSIKLIIETKNVTRYKNEQSYPHHNSFIMTMSFLTITRVYIHFAKYRVAINVVWFDGKHREELDIMKSQHVIDR